MADYQCQEYTRNCCHPPVPPSAHFYSFHLIWCGISKWYYSVSHFSHSVVYVSLQPHGLQHARLPCPSPTPRACSNSCPWSRWCRPTTSSSVVPSSSRLNLSQHQGVFQWVSSLHQVSKLYSGLISFKIDWFDLPVVQGTLESLFQHHSSKASIFQCSAFLMVQLSHPYITTGKTIALTRQTFAGKVMSLLFNMLSRFVIAFLPRSKSILILRPQSPSAVILEPPKVKSVTVSIFFFPIYLP